MSLCSKCFGRNADAEPTQDPAASDVSENRDFVRDVEKALKSHKQGNERVSNCCDVFILHCNNMEDKALAKELGDKFRTIESHLYIVQQSDYKALRSKPRITQGAVSFCPRLIVILSNKYIQEDYSFLRKILTHDSNGNIKKKLIIIRRVEKSKVPTELHEGVNQTVEYNVETDSKFFWYNKSFFQRSIPPSSDILFYTS
ncbi:uncharacterized protein [Antedon mediterranea]|uniref:uncharacterized protein n=1 Tax=Antedon mediterranea TaxID=105859 RepID=UPI003AF60666